MEDLAGFGGGQFGLAGQEMEVHTFFPKVGAIRELAQAVFNFFDSLLDFALFDELMGLSGEALIRTRAGGEEKGEKQAGKGRTHD